MDLKYVLLKDCCSKIGSGATPKGGKSVYIEKGTSFIRSQNVYNLFFSTKGLAYINDDAANKLKGVTVREGDVLLNITGDSVARTCVVPNEVLPARVNQHVAIIRTNHSLDPYYLNYYLASPAMQGYLLNIASTGASRNAITKGAIEKLSIPTPSLDVQRRIASILSAYDNLIENNNRRIRLLEQMAENLYKEWFVRFRFPGHEKAEFESGLPKGWKRNKIKEYYNTCSGGTPSREKNEYYNEGTIFWVKTGEIQDSLIQKTEELISTEGLKHSSAKILPKWTLLMAMYGVNIGKLGIITNEMSCNQAACAFIDKGSIPSVFYLFFYLKSIRSYLLSISFGAAQQNLSQVLIQNLRIVMPQEDVLKSFDNVIRPLYNQICALQQQSELLSRQRDLLLPRLMSGKLEVKV